MIFVAPLVALLATYLVTRFLLVHRFALKVQDIPNARSLHQIPTPRIGGVGLLAGIVCGWLLLFNGLVWWVLLPFMAMFAISLLDDLYNLPVRQRLTAHLATAALAIYGSDLALQAGVLIALLSVFLLVWMTNLFNFMDGSDGLAGGMAAFGFAAYGVAAWQAGQAEFALLNFCIAAAAIGFLLFNFPPARIFMGDAGSIPLGFLVGAMGLAGWQQMLWPAWFPLLVFSPFIADATVTLIKRSLRGVKITEAHREHYYQRLVQMGWSHRKLALMAFALMAASVISAFLALQGKLVETVTTWCLFYSVVMGKIDLNWEQYRHGRHE